MLINATTLTGYKLDSLDGEIGKIKEFYFDDQLWTIRYLVAETGNWLTDRQVLISPHALKTLMSQEQSIAVDLTTKQIEDSPSLDHDKPVSRHFEESYYGHYGWPMYWDGPNVWGFYPSPMRAFEQWEEPTQYEKAWDHHLRSTHAVRGYSIQALDGEIGHVEDFIIDDETWAIRYLVVGTRNWWPGKKVLVAPQWIDRVSWDELKVFVNIDHDTIKQSPKFTEESLLTREYETKLHGHYNREGYWVSEAVTTSNPKGNRGA